MRIIRVDVRRSRVTDDWYCEAWVLRNGIATRWPSLDRFADDRIEAIKLRDEMMNGN